MTPAQRAGRKNAANYAPEVGRRRAATLAALDEAAEAGAPCPSWRTLAARLGVTDHTVALIARELERSGKIAIGGSVRRRTVTIVATGRTTAPAELLPPRDSLYVVKLDEPPPPQAIDRTPCPWCATRADVGCTCRVTTRPATQTLGGIGSSML